MPDNKQEEPGVWEKFKEFGNQLIRQPAEDGQKKKAKNRSGRDINITYNGGKWVGDDDGREYKFQPGTNSVDEIGQSD